MKSSKNLYLFARKEILLIFVFVILISIVSFSLGIKMGKTYSLQQAGYSSDDIQRIKMLSAQAEKMKELEQEVKGMQFDNKIIHKELEKEVDSAFGKLGTQLKSEQGKGKPVDTKTLEASKPAEQIEQTQTSPVASSKDFEGGEQTLLLRGKYTIQLASYRIRKEAKQFSSSFQARGYETIIYQADLKGKGTWFRVSIGVFETVAQAKNYILKESSLFEGQEYYIGRFD